MKPLIQATEKDTNHLFHSDLEKGAYGEYLVKKYLHTFYSNRIDYLEDKSGVHKYQKADIDLLVQVRGRKTQSIEVKNDNTLFPNLFFETVSVSKEGKEDTPGCMLVTEADVLFYVYEALQISVVAPLTKLREWVDNYLENGGELKQKPVYNEGYTAFGYTIPLEALTGEKSGWDAVEGISLVDMVSNKRLSFKQFDIRRINARRKAGGSPYVKIIKEEGWEKERFFEETNQLNILLKTDIDRTTYARKFLDKWMK